MTGRIESQVERFATGFRERILERHVTPPAALERVNPNEVEGDIGGGSNTLWQLLARPVLSTCPYATPLPGLYLCSSSRPPGGGVHGLCGYHAAQVALRRTFTDAHRQSPAP
jgi:phytoene dehydrogenase-like protein